MIHCKSCGKNYRYEKEGCCPKCGAYNRPPKRERVNPDGTIQHMTDAAYERRKAAAGKVCFEEKECHEEKVCYENQTRWTHEEDNPRTTGREQIDKAVALLKGVGARRGSKRANGKSPIVVVVGLIVALSALFNALSGFLEEKNDSHWNGGQQSVEENYRDAKVGETFVLGDGTELTVLDSYYSDDGKNYIVEVEFRGEETQLYTSLYLVDDDDGSWIDEYTVEENGRYIFDVSGWTDYTPLGVDFDTYDADGYYLGNIWVDLT